MFRFSQRLRSILGGEVPEPVLGELDHYDIEIEDALTNSTWGPWTAWTPQIYGNSSGTLTEMDYGTNATQQGYYRTNGPYVEMQANVIFGSAPARPGTATHVLFSVPVPIDPVAAYNTTTGGDFPTFGPVGGAFNADIGTVPYDQAFLYTRDVGADIIGAPILLVGQAFAALDLWRFDLGTFTYTQNDGVGWSATYFTTG